MFNVKWVVGSDKDLHKISSWSVPIMPIMPLELPVTASKLWKRIKGFFRSAWRVIKGVVPRAAKVVSAIVPPPYGTVVAGIGAGVTAIDNVVNAVATGNV